MKNELEKKLKSGPGIKQARKIFGEGTGDKIAEFWSDCDPDFAVSLCNHAYGAMYSRTVLTQKTRELCALMALICLNKPNELTVHIEAAFFSGASEKEIREVIYQAHLYAGIPATMGALVTLRNYLNSQKPQQRKTTPKKGKKPPPKKK